METTTATSTNIKDKELFINMVLSAWNLHNSRISKLLDTITDDQLMAETAPGRNRGIYLIGHLIAVSDNLLPILGLGQRLYPELEKLFVTSPDRAHDELPSITELKSYWRVVNDTLTDHFKKIQPDEWFTKHTLVSAEDFIKEPHRNKLNVVINRTNHTSYHHGQLVYLLKK